MGGVKNGKMKKPPPPLPKKERVVTQAIMRGKSKQLKSPPPTPPLGGELRACGLIMDYKLRIKEMKMKTLIKSSMWLVAAGLLTACASEDTQQKDGTKQSETKYVATFTGHQPNSNSSAKSRTTATHTLGNPAQVIWEATDRIWVKADDGRFYQSETANFAASATTRVPTSTFRKAIMQRLLPKCAMWARAPMPTA